MVELGKLLGLVVEKKADDLYFTVGDPPVVRLKGDLRPLNLPRLSSDDTVRILEALASREIQDVVKAGGSGECDYLFEGGQKFLVTAYLYKGNVALKLRRIPPRLPSQNDEGSPASS